MRPVQNIEPCPELYWFATNKCNLKCIYCCYDSKPEGSDELSTTEAKDLIRQAAWFSKYFVIIGGEPLLRDDLFELLDYAHRICRIGNYLNVTANDDVIPCLFADLKLGNIREKTLEEIWSEVISNSFFRELQDPNRLKGACGECAYRFICGGCRARAYQLTGDWFAADPACVYAPGEA
jgi:radical SAM protein with 4Fe4S-binding SPASM domain